MLATLLLTACTLSEPRQCREVILEASGHGFAAQAAAAEWCAEHPGWVVKKLEVKR